MVLRNVQPTFTFEEQRVEINELAADVDSINAGYNNTNWDTAFSWGNHATAGYLTLSSQTVNVVIGDATTGDAITTGSDNVVLGSNAGSAITNKTNNVFVGALAGAADIGSYNVAIGPNAGDTSFGEFQNVENVAIGRSAGDIRNGNGNTALGYSALSSTATSAFSFGNIALGYQAMGNYKIDGARYNTSIGQQAGFNLSSGDTNVLIGDYAGYGITTGSNNVVIGTSAGDDITTGSNNVIINSGNYQSGATSGFTATTSNSLWIGHSSYAWITGTSSGNTRAVTIPGQLTSTSLDGGTATFSGDVDIAAHTELDTLNVSGVSTFGGNARIVVDEYLGLGDPGSSGFGELRIRKRTNDEGIIQNENGDFVISQQTDSYSNYLKLQARTIRIEGRYGNEVIAQFIDSGAVELNHNGTKKLETTATGVTVTGDLVANTGTVVSDPTATNVAGYAFEVKNGATSLGGLYKTSSNGGFLQLNNGVGTLKASINGEDGSASFGEGDATIAATGQITCNDVVASSTNDTFPVFRGLNAAGNATNFRVNGDGSATFAETVSIGSGSAAPDDYGLIAYANADSLSNKAAVYGRNLNAGGRTFTGDNDTGATTFEVFGNGTVNASGTITAPFIRGDGADATSADTALFRNLTSGGDNRVRINAFANGGGHPYIKFDAGGSNFVVGELYAGTTNNKLVLGVGEDPTGVTGITIDGNGNVAANNLALNQTNGSGATSTVLDHYEEGTWTPAWGSTTGSITNITYDIQSGWYTRIGRVVYVSCRLRSSATDTSGAGGGLVVTGLPFAVRTPQGTGAGAAYSLIDFPAGTINITTEVRENTTQFYAGLYTLDNGNFGNIGPGSLQSTGLSEIRVSFFYMTDT